MTPGIRTLQRHRRALSDGEKFYRPEPEGKLVQDVPVKSDNNQQKQSKTSDGGEDHLQKKMLSDPRFGSPLLCDSLVMLMALVPLFCGLMEYFYSTKKGSLSGFHYGLTLCGIFIFLLGLRSASIHLTSGADNTEERVMYILEKYGGSMWIPKLPDVAMEDDDSIFSGYGIGRGGSSSRQQQRRSLSLSGEPRLYRLVVDPATAVVYQISERRSERPTDLKAREEEIHP